MARALGFSAAPQFAELISDLFGDEEDITPPGILLETDRPEYSFSKKERLWTTGPIAIAANVGNVSLVQLNYAPANLGGATGRMVATVRGIKVCGVNVVAGDRYQLTHNGAAAAVPIANFAEDTRWDAPGGVTGRTALQNNILNTVVGVSGDIWDEVSADVTGKDLYFSALPIVLHQGAFGGGVERIAVFTVAQNKALRVVFWGTERQLRSEAFDQT